MKALSANEAKTQFGNLLLNAQREPVQINKNGKPVAVILSVDDYQDMELLKLELLQGRATKAIKDNNIKDGDKFFQQVMSGQYD